ncbi:Trypomastigote, Alanine, Serine and Valine rich protein (TASV), subfamily A [Trypanosoma cruzi]|uniref:Trypomastigote, Alanine, Serine and Valine rich protein (TASV), subfamily A n=1 Tax=Trypanosoma cruzi TaxID=5693 RepID=A0A2V2WHW4_TRYCR|nr:Trypomastigote, Alanine, Serine and Valine rich protein (TASV), subfamily A [Trypanosoma cruzi]
MWRCVREWLRGEGQRARCPSLFWEMRCMDSPLGSWDPCATFTCVRWHDSAGEGSLRSCVLSPRCTWAAGRLADAAERGIRCHLPGRQRNVTPLMEKCGILICPLHCFLFPVRHTAYRTPTHRHSCLHISCGLGNSSRARALHEECAPLPGSRDCSHIHRSLGATLFYSFPFCVRVGCWALLHDRVCACSCSAAHVFLSPSSSCCCPCPTV